MAPLIDAMVIRKAALPVLDADRTPYTPRIWGAPRPDGRWTGWLEFVSDDGRHRRTPPETTQSSLAAVRYWAAGLERVYIEGAFRRARERAETSPRVDRQPAISIEMGETHGDELPLGGLFLRRLDRLVGLRPPVHAEFDGKKLMRWAISSTHADCCALGLRAQAEGILARYQPPTTSRE